MTSRSDDLWILDAFCGAGGMTKGYQRAGFKVIGVDIDPQPNYCGDRFIQADAMQVLEAVSFLRVAGIHASPPCQGYTDLKTLSSKTHPLLVPKVRELLKTSGLPYVIENVEGAPMENAVKLCGTMFPGLRVIRHRLFETNFPLPRPRPCPTRHPLVFTHDKRKAHHGKLNQDTSYVQVTGGGNCTVANKADAMGIDWMTGAELNEAIPPAYAEWVGEYLMTEIAGGYCDREIARDRATSPLFKTTAELAASVAAFCDEAA